MTLSSMPTPAIDDRAVEARGAKHACEARQRPHDDEADQDQAIDANARELRGAGVSADEIELAEEARARDRPAPISTSTSITQKGDWMRNSGSPPDRSREIVGDRRHAGAGRDVGQAPVDGQRPERCDQRIDADARDDQPVDEPHSAPTRMPTSDTDRSRPAPPARDDGQPRLRRGPASIRPTGRTCRRSSAASSRDQDPDRREVEQHGPHVGGGREVIG